MKRTQNLKPIGVVAKACCDVVLAVSTGRSLRRRAGWLASGLLALVLSWPAAVQAVPYAAAVTRSGDTVSFILNEDADNVTVVFDGGARTSDLGALPKGRHSFNLDGATSFQIVVRKVSGPGWLVGVTNQISDDNNRLVRFVNQRGVAVNKNPASPLFGRIYVSVGSAGVNADVNRPLGDGIYVLNPDLTDALGQGDTALTGGIDWVTTTPPNPEGPHRLTVGPDDSLYICDWGDTNGSVFVTDGNVSDGSGQNLFAGPTGSRFPLGSASGKTHGSICAVVVEGSLSAGNLTVYVIDEDLQTDKDSSTMTERNSIWRWDIGAGPLPAAGPPVKVSGVGIIYASQLCDLIRGPDGKFYKSQRRAEPPQPASSVANIYVLSPEGSLLWDSLSASRALLQNSSATDLMNETCALDISPDGKYLAVLRRDTNLIWILPLIDGIPDLTNRIRMPTLPATGVARDLAFDAAGNLYVVSSGQGLLRVYSPGGPSVATTSSDGTFSVVFPPSVNVSVTQADGFETGPSPIIFTVTREGSTVEPMTVRYALSGTASNGVDYPDDPLTVTIPAGQSTAEILIVPEDDWEAELTETVVVTLLPSMDYQLKPPITATGYIVDNDENVVTLAVVDGHSFERVALDTLAFQLTRLGDTNLELFVSYTTGGTAVPGLDYLEPISEVVIPPGVVSSNLVITPLYNPAYTGDKTVVITVVDGTGYTAGAPASGTGVIRDAGDPPAPVLFADDFDTDTSANWLVRFGANNNIYDANVVFAHDYSQLGIPPAPHTLNGTTRGLFLNVNKNDATASAAAVNLYPLNQVFRGDYALRFDLYVSVGGTATTEHTLAGLNHSGQNTNRVRLTGTAPPVTTDAPGADGVWVAMVADASGLRDYAAYTSTNPATVPALIALASASTMRPFLPSPPYYSPAPGVSGSPSNPYGSPTPTWAEVELRQVGNVITLMVNKAVVFQVTNTSPFTEGTIMLGLNDAYDSVGSTNSFVIFDNVRVVSLAPPTVQITRIQLIEPDLVQIDFTAAPGAEPSDYHLQRTASLSPPAWQDDPAATITVTAEGMRAQTTRSGPMQFYRIRR